MHPTDLDHPNPQPDRPDEQDRLLDLKLAALPRFDPSPGFADRVMALVRIHHPAPARIPWYTRPGTMPAGIQRLAAAVAIMAATSSSVLTFWAISNFQSLAESTGRYATTFAVVLREEFLRLATHWLSFLAGTGAAIIASIGWPAAGAIVTGSLAAIPLGMLGLYLVSRHPAHTGRPNHARR